jgi:DNA-binding MarR family transcriptional regulator
MDEPLTSDHAARLRLAINRLHRRLRSSASDGVTPSQVSMLASVERLGSPSLGDLAAEERIQPPSVTKIVQVLESLELISCSPDEDDRRSTRVRITPQGRRELASIRQRKTEFLERRLRALSAQERRQVPEVSAFLERLLEGE